MKDCVIVLFGGTGNLAYKKLYPALYKLYERNLMPNKFVILSLGRRNIELVEFKNIVKLKIKQFSNGYNEKVLNGFVDFIKYQILNFDKINDYVILKGRIDDCVCSEKMPQNRIFYLATAPGYFEIITNNLELSGILDIKKDAYKRIVIEKPFGKDLAEAKSINKTLRKVFSENEIYRTDHYLGKAMIQNIMVLRFSNALFEPLWNSECIDNVQITVSETIGVEERGGYYETSGAFRDMIQSHLIQILALFAMDVPNSLETEDIRNEKVKVIKAMKFFTNKDIVDNLVLGQYEGNSDVKSYVDESKVNPNSLTETFVAIGIDINNKRWKGTKFYLRTGKRLKKKIAEIVVEFKNTTVNKFYYDLLKNKDNAVNSANLLRIKIQPEEGISLSFNVKKPSTDNIIVQKEMDYCQSCDIDMKSPEAYEKLIIDAISGDQSLYARWDEVEAAWSFVDKISKTCLDRSRLLKKYKSSTWGPKEAELMMKKNDLKWWSK
ncbi:glucose-6-phosphate dehydrogenase [Helicovermis profundi]|uniref:Glucose-6-phosphate 1-dehydrogenase n=1 Tax=Helicovermis profundi TaxID=3065157 RepID=A0AAU9ENZ3_9FIRM|nr:glucose-6-phosphate dehydrogenase [Clostridia bacterium S502]